MDFSEETSWHSCFMLDVPLTTPAWRSERIFTQLGNNSREAIFFYYTYLRVYNIHIMMMMAVAQKFYVG